MIQSKKDYIDYVSADFEANKFGRMKLRCLNIRYQYLRCLRRYEYVLNVQKYPSFVKFYYKYKLYRLSVKSGIQIPPNTFGKGLYLPHHGLIVVNETARFGDNCVVQAGVNVSENVRGGNHIYLAAGCKIMKNVIISNNVIVGANAVVTKNVEDDYAVMAGVPAKIISHNGFGNRNQPI